MTGPSPAAPPTVTIGLPVYNGERYLRQALDGLLAQTFTDFELVISDNASTDGTAQICQEYAARDPRVRYLRQQQNCGAVPNHNLLVRQARGRYFKWASHDDCYGAELVARCVEALEADPQAVLAHVDDAIIDPQGVVVDRPPYPLDSANPRPHRRLSSLLYADGGNDFYGVIRTEVLRSVAPHDSYPHADRTFMAGLALAGPWAHVPELLYYRREHPGRATHAGNSRRWAAVLDPRRADARRYPWTRLYGEYVLGFFGAIRAARLTPVEKVRCAGTVLGWLATRLHPARMVALLEADGVLFGSPEQE